MGAMTLTALADLVNDKKSAEELSRQTAAPQAPRYTAPLSAPSLVLPGAEFHGAYQREELVDDPNLDTGYFGSQQDYNAYLRSQGLGDGANYSQYQHFAPAAKGEPSAEDQQAIGQAYATGDPVIDRGDGWYTMVYSGDGTNSMNSARVLPSEYKMNEDGGFSVRGSAPSAYLTEDRFGYNQPKDPYDYQQWVAEHPESNHSNKDISLREYAQECAETQHEILVYPDPRDAAQINPILRQGMQEREAEKQATQNVSETEQQVNSGVTQVENAGLSSQYLASGAAASPYVSVLPQMSQEITQMLKQLFEKMNQQLGSDSMTAEGTSITNQFQDALSEQRETVATDKLDASKSPQFQDGLVMA